MPHLTHLFEGPAFLRIHLGGTIANGTGSFAARTWTVLKRRDVDSRRWDHRSSSPTENVDHGELDEGSENKDETRGHPQVNGLDVGHSEKTIIRQAENMNKDGTESMVDL